MSKAVYAEIAALTAQKGALLDRMQDALSGIEKLLSDLETDGIDTLQDDIDRYAAETDALDKALHTRLAELPQDAADAIDAAMRRGEDNDVLPRELTALCRDIYKKLCAIEAGYSKNRTAIAGMQAFIHDRLRQSRRSQSALRTYMGDHRERGSLLDRKE